MISILIPVYNVENYLRACLNSILGQDFDNFEVIMINDGSTDSSAAICEEYVLKDGRFKLYHQPNQGFGEARNTALRYAVGDFIYFMDSDDILLPGVFSEVMNAFNEFHYDTVFFGFRKNYQGKGKTVYFDMVPPALNVQHAEEAGESIASMLLKGLGFGVWQQVFSKSLLDRASVTFPKLKREADIAFLLELYKHVRSFNTIPKVFYLYQAYYAAHKNNADVLPNHIVLYERLNALFEHHKLASQNVNKILDRYFLLWFAHVIPLHIYLSNTLSFHEKLRALAGMLKDKKYKQWRDEALSRKSEGVFKTIVLSAHCLDSALLLYSATAVNHFMKYRLRLNYKKIFYKNAGRKLN